MTIPFSFTVGRSLFTVCYLFTVIRDQWLTASSKYTVNSKWLMVNKATKGSI